MSALFNPNDPFTITIEVVPPAGSDPEALLGKLSNISHLPFQGFSVASNPVAKPRMSAMAFSGLIRQKTGKQAILHFTVRDHNRLGLQSDLWGAQALGIDTVICLTGDPSANRPENQATTVNDLNVCQLITMAGESGLHTGAVLDFRPERDGLAHEVTRLEKKIAAGCKFIVTQPIYDEKTGERILSAVEKLKVPVIMGILPLLSFKHAIFLHEKVAGIAVPKPLRDEMETSTDPIRTGIQQSRQMLAMARGSFSGACIMPPFERFEILTGILEP